MKRRTIILTVALAISAAALYAGWPRAADLRAFEPAGMAQLETAMWRDYYEKHYGALFYHLYEVSRSQFGFFAAGQRSDCAGGGRGREDLSADPIAARGGRN